MCVSDTFMEGEFLGVVHNGSLSLTETRKG